MNLLRFLGDGIVIEEGTWGQEMLAEIQPILLAILSLVGAVAVGYAIFLGASLAKAEDESRRRQAKSRITKTLAGLFIIVILCTTMMIPGPDETTFLSNILTGTVNRVHYRIETVNFEMGKPMQIILYRNGKRVDGGSNAAQSGARNTENTKFNNRTAHANLSQPSGGASFTVEDPGDAGISIESNGVITAQGPGSGTIRIRYESDGSGRVTTFYQTIYIRRENQPPPPPERPVDLPPPGFDLPPSGGAPPGSTGKSLQDFLNLAASFIGRSGYTQVMPEGVPNRNTVNYLSHHFIEGERVDMAIRYFDCSSFTNFLFASVDVQIGTDTGAQKTSTQARRVQKKDLQPGDLVGWRVTDVNGVGSGHVGIYLGNVGPVKEFGTFGKEISGEHMYIHCSGTEADNKNDAPGYFWSNWKKSTYRRGVVYGTININRTGFFAARPYRFPS